MNNINTEELKLIISEIERLSSSKESQIDRQQLTEIITELNLPIELLDEAILAVERNKNLAQKRKKLMLISAALSVLVVLGISYPIIRWQKYQEALAKMMAIDSRITLEEDNKQNLEIINREDSPRLHFRVTFKDTPVGQPLSLGCDWINSQGEIIHQNRYQTRPVEKEIWHTRCRYRIGNNSVPGTWQVQMFSGDRLLREQTFQVE